ncbi:MAG: tRNA (adenosine(37)-N6)-dimethylallyltransferase MiaA [Rhodocyclaceae bacterium]|nr:tRNA (adenosine(37)-N6)-dimethylallyltransferase MiaA [Rhodocyclaceae bacterium]
MNRPPALALIGPTASGKTELALKIAERFPVEIVSLDSAQVFIDMDIGTAKPDRATLARHPHHLIDLITPEESYSAARFRADALRVMAEITARGRVPLLVGGTMLYYKALVEGLAELPAANADLRAEIDAQARLQGWPALHAELARLDPATAARLSPNDSQRIQRALEIVRLTGQPLGELIERQARAELPYRLLTLALVAPDRSMLHARIAQRFRVMLAAGLVAEVEALRAKYRLSAELPAMRCVGYRQVWEMLEGRLPAAELAERGIYATRQFAKRQLTWLRALNDAGRLDGAFDLAETATAEKILPMIDRQLAGQTGLPPHEHA